MTGKELNYSDTRQELSGVIDALMEKIAVRPSMKAEMHAKQAAKWAILLCGVSCNQESRALREGI